MAHLVVIVGILAFFGIAALYVALCDRVVGPDDADGVAVDAVPHMDDAAQ